MKKTRPLAKAILLSLFLTVFALNTSAQKVTLSFQNETFEKVLNSIKQQTGLSLVFSEQLVNLNRKVSINVNSIEVEDAMKQLLTGTNLGYEIKNNKLYLVEKKNVEQKNTVTPSKKITGLVTDEKGDPIIGATVVIKGTKKGTITNLNGEFSVDCYDSAPLIISYLGYISEEVSARPNQKVVLRENTKNLNEVVVIGYGTIKKQNLTNAVAKISEDALRERPLPSLGEALQGQMAGVRATSTTGMPGEEVSIQIRGLNTINGDPSPLYVIDGIPTESMKNINPSDIASVQILKDASATSIYGARGGNGVVLIETKQGTGTPTVSFDAYYGFQDPVFYPNIMSQNEYLSYISWYRNNNYLRSGGSMSTLMTSRPENVQIPTSWLEPDKLPMVDWQREIFRTAPVQNYQISASGKNSMGQIYISGGYFDQQGIVKGTYSNRMNFRLNSTLNINKSLLVGISVSPTRELTDTKNAELKEGSIQHAMTMPPTIGLNQNTRDWGYAPGYGSASLYPNPVEQLKSTISFTKKTSSYNSFWLNLRMSKTLNFKSQFSYNFNDVSYEFFQPGNVSYNNNNVTLGNSNFGRWDSWTLQNTLTYDKKIKENSLNILLGQSVDEFMKYRISAEATGWPGEGIPTLNVATTPILAATEHAKNRSASFFGRVNFNFLDKYLFVASMRYDGSSRFGGNKKWGLFPSASAAWKINNESFLRNVNWLSLLKVRASWGVAGNDRIGDYEYLQMLVREKSSIGNQIQSGLAFSNIANNDLRWESTTTNDIGIDFYAFENRLQLNFDYYYNTTDNLLFNVPIPTTSGFGSLRANIGSISNQGWDLDISSQNITGVFSWSTSLNISSNKNKVLTMGIGDQFTSTLWDGQFITRVGGPVSQFYIYRTNGVLGYEDFDITYNSSTKKYIYTPKVPVIPGQEPGNPRYIDKNIDGTINTDDLTPYGSNLPDLTYGLTNRFKYKDFELSVLLQGSLGGQIMFLGSRHLDAGSSSFNQFRRWVNCWKPDYNKYWPGEDPMPSWLNVDLSWDGKTPYPFGKWDNNDDRRIYDASFLRVKNLTFSYRLIAKSKEKIPFKNIKTYFSVDNLAMFTNYPGANPEANNSGNNTTILGVDYAAYPLSRKYVIGLTVTF